MMNLTQALQTSFAMGIEVGKLQVVEDRAVPRGASLAVDLYESFGPEPLHVILDIGANVGQSARAFAQHFREATIYCFEPVATAYRDLVRNTADLPRVKTFQLAAGASEGDVVIGIPAESALSSIVVRTPGDREERVPMTTVDAFCAVHGIDKIDLLKIDTEGYDLVVLEGARELLRSGRARFILVEAVLIVVDLHSRFVCARDFVRVLAEHGYEAFGIYDQMPHLDGRRSLGYFNLLFAHASEFEGRTWQEKAAASIEGGA